MRIEIWLQEQFHHKMSDFNEKILNFLICPKTGSKLLYDKKKKVLYTKDRKNNYQIKNNILNLFIK